MPTQSTPLPEHDHIAGLVDGSIMLQRDSEGNLSLRVTLGTGPEHQRPSPLLEVGLPRDSAEDLSRFLVGSGEETLRLNCHVGVRARDV